MTENTVIIIYFIKSFIKFLMLTLNIFIKISKFYCLEIINNIQINFILLLILKIIIILGNILFTRYHIVCIWWQCIGIVWIE